MAGNINTLHARSVRKTRVETTQQIAVPDGIQRISGKRQPSKEILQIDMNRYETCLSLNMFYTRHGMQRQGRVAVSTLELMTWMQRQGYEADGEAPTKKTSILNENFCEIDWENWEDWEDGKPYDWFCSHV